MGTVPLFFDLDHTLWDFVSNSRKTLREGYEAFALFDLGVADFSEWIRVFERTNDWCWEEYRQERMDKTTLRSARFEIALKTIGSTATVELAKELDAHYILHSPKQTGLIDGTLVLLKELKQRGHQMWILTNGFEEVQRIKLQCCGLSPFFEAMYTSEELGVKKPHPDAFRKAAEAAGLSGSEDIVMIGDSWQSDVEGSQKAGWRGIHYNPGNEIKPEAWRTVHNLHEILDLPLNLGV
jgi:putative hydrolase of the HAD superfamily